MIEWNGSGLGESAETAALVTNHEVTLSRLDRSTLYFFRVKSVDAEGVDGQSQLYSFRLAPLPPASVVAMGGDGRVDVVWEVHDDFSVAGFNVYGRQSGTSSWSKLNSSLVYDTIYTDQAVNNGVAYEYSVSSVDHDGNEGERSAEDSTTPQAASATTLSARLSPDAKGRLILSTSGSPYTIAENGALIDNGTLYIAPGTVMNDSGVLTIKENTFIRGTKTNRVTLGAQLSLQSGTFQMLHSELQKGLSPPESYTLAFNTFKDRPNLNGKTVANVIANTYQLSLNRNEWEYPRYFINNEVSNLGIYISSSSTYKFLFNRFTGSENAFNILVYENSPLSIRFNTLNKVSVRNNDSYTFDLGENYWGATTTAEMESKGANANIGAIYDVHDNWERATIDYSNWLTAELPHTGTKLDGPTWPEVVREDTKGQEVTFKARAYGAVKMMVSTDGTFTDPEQGDVDWKDYAMRRTILTNQPSEILYARFQDAEGDESYVGVEGMSYDLE